MRRRAFLSAGIAIPVSQLMNTAYALGPLKIGQAEGSYDQTITTRILTLVYDRLNIPMQTVIVPSRRAVVEAAQGVLDGLTHRIFEVGEENPTLVRIPTPINHVEPTLFSKQPERFVDIASVTGQRIGIRRGARLAEIATKGLEPVVSATSPLQLMRLLAEDRLDVVILSRENGFAALRKLGKSSIRPAPRPLYRLPLFHYLHRKHAQLVDRLDGFFKELTTSGELRKLRVKYFEKVVGEPDLGGTD